MLLACATFPLVWIGGLVTSSKAGMAVPDWPTTYGYNPFLYPLATWWHASWDVFVEHGHRLFGALVGLLAINLVIFVWACDRRKWLRWAAIGALALVCVQGVLGGLRVKFDDAMFARIHGCIGPLFFAYTAALAAFTSRYWSAVPRPVAEQAARLHRLTVSTAAIAYVQIVLGALLRDRPYDASMGEFRAVGLAHFLMAVALAAHVVLVAVRVVRSFGSERLLRRPAFLLCGLIVVQIGLGLATWVTHYGFPAWLTGFSWAANFTVTDQSAMQIQLTTAHVACGALIFAAAVVLAVRSLRLYQAEPRLWHAGGKLAGVAA
jgi:cytochrome c oxidase assembly protein subunit 15